MRKATGFRDEEPTEIRKAKISPIREAMIMEKAPSTEEDRLKMLEVSGLPITTPETVREVIEPALAVPRGIVEGAFATGAGALSFMTGATGYRVISELIAGASIEEAEERSGGGLYSALELFGKPSVYVPESEFGQRVAEYAGKPFEIARKGVEWVVPIVIEEPIRRVLKTMRVSDEEADKIIREMKILPYAEAALGAVVEFGAWALLAKTLKTKVGKGKPTPEAIIEASKEVVRLRKKEQVPTERPISPEAKALSAEILAEMEKRAPKVTKPREPIVEYKRKREPTVEDRDISPVRKTEEGLPVAPEEPAIVGKPAPEPTIAKKVDLKKPTEPPPADVLKPVDKRTQRKIVEADDYGIPPDDIAVSLKLREGQVTDVLETLAAKRDIITMKQVETEFKYILDRAAKLPEEARLDFLHEGTSYLTTKYMRNLDAGFADKIELARYIEWGDQIMGKITNARRKAGLVPEPPTVTAEFGGFQWLYEGFVNRIKKRGTVKGQPLSTRGEEMLNRGLVIKQRKVKGREYPPLYEGEYQLVKGANILDERWFRRAFENPIRVFEEAGGEAFLDLTIHPYHAAEKAYAIAWKATKKNINELRSQVSRREKRNIMNYAVSKQKKGPALLKYMKIKKVSTLTPKEVKVYEQLRTMYESWYRRINNVRKAIGKEPLPYTEDYFTFFRDLTMMEQMGFKPLDMPLDILEAQFIKMQATPFKYAKARTKAIYRLEMDPFYVLERYSQSALRHIHMSPLVAKLHELTLDLKDPVTGKVWNMCNENPILAKAWNGWLNHIAGKKPSWSLGPFDSVMQRVNSNLTAAILGANVRSAMIQVTALRNTVTEIGFTRTMEGVYDLAYSSERSFAMRKSKVLSTRKMEVSVDDAIRSMTVGRWSEAKAGVGRLALKPLQILDLKTAEATWLGAYKHATKDLGMNKGSKRAFNYADDVVTRTQASALPGDIAPVQRPVVGKFMTLFQTFTINDWNFLIRDVLGKRNVTYKTPGALAKTMRYVAATTMFNILMEDVLKINSPLPTPIRAFRESLERGDDIPSTVINVGKEFIEPIPVISSARYEFFGPAGLQLMNEVLKWVYKTSMHKPGLELLGKWIGMPGTAQMGKMARAKKRGETTYGQIVGTYTPPEKRRRPARRERRGLGGGLGGGIRGGL